MYIKLNNGYSLRSFSVNFKLGPFHIKKAHVKGVWSLPLLLPSHENVPLENLLMSSLIVIEIPKIVCGGNPLKHLCQSQIILVAIETGLALYPV